MAHVAALSLLLLSYLATSLHHLESVPAVFEDEPWQASTGWKLAQEGVFGSDMFAGFYGTDQRYYGFMPVFPLLLAATFLISGVGVFEARLTTVLLGLCTLLLTYTLGRRLFGPSVGLLALALMLTVRLAGITTINPTGILLVDSARIARYDAAVPVFGLASLHLYLFARQRSDPRLFALAGLLAALASLSHVYGAFWIIALGVLALWDGISSRSLIALASGFAVPVMAYVAYVLQDIPGWIGQTRIYGPRFGLLDLTWYWDNLSQEYRRYGPGLGSVDWHYLLRPGLWATLAFLPLSLLGLAYLAIQRGDRAARAIVVPALLFPLLFALLIHMKIAPYLATVMPLGAVAAAWGAVSIWRWSQSTHYGNSVRACLVALGIAVGAEGTAQIATLTSDVSSITPYNSYITRVGAHVPTGSRTLGPHRYWFGMEDRDYRAWLVPVMQADERFWFPALSLDEALNTIDPDVILIDEPLRIYFNNNPDAKQSLTKWMSLHGYVKVMEIEDQTYGTMEIIHRDETNLCGSRSISMDERTSSSFGCADSYRFAGNP